MESFRKKLMSVLLIFPKMHPRHLPFLSGSFLCCCVWFVSASLIWYYFHLPFLLTARHMGGSPINHSSRCHFFRQRTCLLSLPELPAAAPPQSPGTNWPSMQASPRPSRKDWPPLMHGTRVATLRSTTPSTRTSQFMMPSKNSLLTTSDA